MSNNKGWFGNAVQSVKTGAGNAVSGTFSAVGNGVSTTGKGVGGSVSNTSRGWADGLRSYGNAIKDASGASGPRAATGSNPLGIAGSGSSGLKTSKAYAGQGSSSRKGTAGDPLGLNR